MNTPDQERNDLSAVQSNPENIKNMPEEEQTFDVQCLAIDHDPNMLQYIINPFSKITFMALKRDPKVIRFIYDPSWKEIVQAFTMCKSTEDFDVICDLIEPPSEKLLWIYGLMKHKFIF